jgi:hypothetical protein
MTRGEAASVTHDDFMEAVARLRDSAAARASYL